MESVNNGKEKLENAVRTCLIEINKLKSELAILENENHNLKHNTECEKSISLKEDEIIELKTSLAEKESFILNQEEKISNQKGKIEELSNIKNSFEDIKNSLERDLNKFKTTELGNYNKKFQDALESIVEKENSIKTLNKEKNELKEKIVELQSNITSKETILNLQNEINSKDLVIKELKYNKDDESLVSTLRQEIKSKNQRIEELEHIKSSFDDIRSSLENDLEHLKKEELTKANNELKSALDTIVDKDKLITELNNKARINNEKIESLNIEVESKIAEIKKLKTDCVSREELASLKSEIKEKDSKISKLEKIKGLFSDLDNIHQSPQLSQSHQSLQSSQSSQSYQLSLDSANVEDSIRNDLNISNNALSECQNKILKLQEDLKLTSQKNKVYENEISNYKNKINVFEENAKSHENEIKEYLDNINKQNDLIDELKKYKKYFYALTAPPLKNLSSFQSQVYNLVPETPTEINELFEFIRDTAFSSLTLSNLNNVLKSLENKGFMTHSEDDDKILWSKLSIE
ncbi:hypothetical protein [Methanobrevibacter curvatus]|uniref:Chromosome partition protein Smc n=1 Tax=Methanobrevibacter curvatus TaxID=49547 RepID=A0A166A8P2_9EURY|nr:hypothetical protein [Methanobrevibacter curvatus]KZX11718.1 chromosome partition protein Smc [Methanobrevibacter curvatus]